MDYDFLLHPVAPSRESPSMGTAFDTSTIAPQIRELRQDHLAALRARPRHASHQSVLVAMARQAITHLSFFHRRTSGDETENRKA
jgi:hypothetical protein